MVNDFPKVTQLVEARGAEMGSVLASAACPQVVSSTPQSPFKVVAHAFWVFSFLILHAKLEGARLESQEKMVTL